MNRRSFLKLLGAAIAAPFMAKAKIAPPTDNSDGIQYDEDGWEITDEWADFDDDYEDDYEEKWPNEDQESDYLDDDVILYDGTNVGKWHVIDDKRVYKLGKNETTIKMIVRAEYSLDHGKTWRNLLEGSGIG